MHPMCNTSLESLRIHLAKTASFGHFILVIVISINLRLKTHVLLRIFCINKLCMCFSLNCTFQQENIIKFISLEPMREYPILIPLEVPYKHLNTLQHNNLCMDFQAKKFKIVPVHEKNCKDGASPQLQKFRNHCSIAFTLQLTPLPLNSNGDDLISSFFFFFSSSSIS